MANTEVDMEEGGVQKYVDCYWGEIEKTKKTTGQVPFPALVQVTVAVLGLPRNNVHCGRPFSVIWHVHTGCRGHANSTFTVQTQQRQVILRA